ncbi:glycosyltransferase family 25 protein [Photobacterium damselae]|uniref:glycosyltransferase family 25 protein n=1 Tax=Photobacterium damselae TaxID=38293 RepID=UPI001F36421A|nr:glycosyltransferase family 25 protein [Photobacterium damselae]UKA03969.1 glycosyltransferase family 25 protein [Photobacterium damselae subsp. damselae]
MKIFCITTGNTARITSINSQVSFDFEFHYSKSIDDCVSEVGINTKKAKHWRLKGLNSAEVACFHSHIVLWERCVLENEPFFIFEDNIKVVADIDLDFISQCSVYGLVSFAQRKEFDNITPHYRKNFYSRAYIISPGAARKLLQTARKEAIYMPVDNFLSEWPLHKVRGYCSPKAYFSRIGRNTLSSLVGNDARNADRYSRFDIFNPFFISTRIQRIITRVLLHKHIL